MVRLAERVAPDLGLKESCVEEVARVHRGELRVLCVVEVVGCLPLRD